MTARPTRRAAIALGAAAAAFPAAAAVADPVATARRLVETNRARLPYRDVAALADFSLPSWRPRLHLVDIETGRSQSFLVAHGRGSDPLHTGWLQRFSNAPGSNATSAGAYLTLGFYEGKYGRSLRLAGLDAENSNAEARAIVAHPAWYVSEEMIRRTGKLGRSEGCFALAADDLEAVIGRLGRGRLLYAGKFV